MDLKETRIRNPWIWGSWLAAIIWQLIRLGPGGLFFFLTGAGAPILCLFPLFRCRMLGAGDIKLFSVLGGFFGVFTIFRCMICSFLIGAVFSAVLLIKRGILPQRLKYFLSYFQTFSIFHFLNVTADYPPYHEKTFGPECIHFSIPIFLAVLLKLGGIY